MVTPTVNEIKSRRITDNMLDTRCTTHPVHPALWVVKVRLYGETWSTVCEGTLFECVRHANYLAGITPQEGE